MIKAAERLYEKGYRLFGRDGAGISAGLFGLGAGAALVCGGYLVAVGGGIAALVTAAMPAVAATVKTAAIAGGAVSYAAGSVAAIFGGGMCQAGYCRSGLGARIDRLRGVSRADEAAGYAPHFTLPEKPAVPDAAFLKEGFARALETAGVKAPRAPKICLPPPPAA